MLRYLQERLFNGRKSCRHGIIAVRWWCFSCTKIKLRTPGHSRYTRMYKIILITLSLISCSTLFGLLGSHEIIPRTPMTSQAIRTYEYIYKYTCAFTFYAPSTNSNSRMNCHTNPRCTHNWHDKTRCATAAEPMMAMQQPRWLSDQVSCSLWGRCELCAILGFVSSVDRAQCAFSCFSTIFTGIYA